MWFSQLGRGFTTCSADSTGSSFLWNSYNCAQSRIYSSLLSTEQALGDGTEHLRAKYLLKDLLKVPRCKSWLKPVLFALWGEQPNQWAMSLISTGNPFQPDPALTKSHAFGSIGPSGTNVLPWPTLALSWRPPCILLLVKDSLIFSWSLALIALWVVLYKFTNVFRHVSYVWREWYGMHVCVHCGLVPWPATLSSGPCTIDVLLWSLLLRMAYSMYL